MYRSLAAVALAVLLCACATSNDASAIAGVTVINPRQGSVAQNKTVLVRNGRIEAIHPASAAVPRRANVIDGRGKFLIPGLWDAHVHLGKLGPNALSLFIANGVTGVRDMGSNLAELKTWRSEIESGSRVGPRMMISGPMIESQANLDRMLKDGGVEPAERQRIGVASPEEGRAAVRGLAAAGVDQIKMRSSPDAATFAAVSDEARRQNLPFAAHNLAEPEVMLQVGLSSVEHYLSLPPLATLGVSETARRSLFQRMAKADFHVSNTAANLKPLMTPYEMGRAIVQKTAESNDPLRKYVCGYLVADWGEQVEESRTSQMSQFAPLLPIFYAELHEMFDEKVPLLAGTDAAVMFVYPGFSLHDELEIMVREVHLAPMDVLRIATNGVPAYWKRDSTMGGIERGQVADLVLLNADPLADIANTRRIEGVMSNGHWFGRAALDRLLKDVELDGAAACTGGSTLARTLPGRALPPEASAVTK